MQTITFMARFRNPEFEWHSFMHMLSLRSMTSASLSQILGLVNNFSIAPVHRRALQRWGSSCSLSPLGVKLFQRFFVAAIEHQGCISLVWWTLCPALYLRAEGWLMDLHSCSYTGHFKHPNPNTLLSIHLPKSSIFPISWEMLSYLSN